MDCFTQIKKWQQKESVVNWYKVTALQEITKKRPRNTPQYSLYASVHSQQPHLTPRTHRPGVWPPLILCLVAHSCASAAVKFMPVPTASVLWFQWQLFIHWKASERTHGPKVSIRLFSLPVCTCFYHVADTGELNSLDLPLLLFLASLIILWILRHLSMHFFCLQSSCIWFGEINESTNSKVTLILTRGGKKNFIFGWSVSDLIRVNKSQCGEGERETQCSLYWLESQGVFPVIYEARSLSLISVDNIRIKEREEKAEGVEVMAERVRAKEGDGDKVV